jgi:hypothetical protein
MIRKCRRAGDGGILAEDSSRDGGVDAGVDFRGHEPRPEDLGSAVADLPLEIAHEERVKDIEGEEGDQQESLYGMVCRGPCKRGGSGVSAGARRRRSARGNGDETHHTGPHLYLCYMKSMGYAVF